ncbi:MAG: spore coat associated protein CotJA [Lachnospiraceae bacterium]|nr:spore coat associated protein CotJA [Lachnospiraceae bacterium]
MPSPCQNIENTCGKRTEDCCVKNGLEGMPLGMSYVPWQHWKETYEPCKALLIGTIFPELNLPFLERSCGR